MGLTYSYLSHVTGKKKYRKAIQKIHKALNKMPTMDGLLPVQISMDINEGVGVYSMGSLSDSYYEYLLKAWIQGHRPDKTFTERFSPL